MKVFRLLFAPLLFLAAAGAAQTPVPWQEPDAAYRLELTTEHPENCAGFQLGRNLLPADPEQGLAVFDGKGNRLGYNFSRKNGMLVISPSPNDRQRLVYLGFAKPREVKFWQREHGTMPGDEKLVMELSHSRIDYAKVRERFKKRNRKPDASALAGYFTPRRRIHETVVKNQVKLNEIPRRFRKNISVAFTGQLKITTPGEYTFAADSNSSMFLEIDGRALFFRFEEHPKNGNWKEQATVKLAAGMHQFRMCYHYNEVYPDVEAVWRKPGEKEFKSFSADDFFPGWPAENPILVDRLNQHLPLATREFTRTLQYGKEEKIFWVRYRLPESKQTFRWLLDQTEVGHSHQVDLLIRDPDKQVITLESDPSSGFCPLVAIPRRSYQEDVIVYPDLYLKTFAPIMVFDDEEFSLTLETVSAMPGMIHANLQIAPDRVNPVWKAVTEKLELERENNAADEFVPAASWKKSFSVPAGAVNRPLQLELVLSMAGREFDRRTIIFRPWKEITSIQGDETGFTDGKGHRVIPVLHRPTLAERRTWALPRQLTEVIKAPRRLLLVADGRPTELTKALEQQLNASGTEVEILTWPEANSKLGALLQAVGTLKTQLTKTKADALILMPPDLDQWSWLPADTIPQLLSALLESAVANPGLNSIAVATPVPSRLAAEMVEYRQSTAIKKLARDYEVRLLDLNAAMKTPEKNGKALSGGSAENQTVKILMQCWR